MRKEDLTVKKFKEMLNKSYLFTVSSPDGSMQCFRPWRLNKSDFDFFDDGAGSRWVNRTYRYFLSQYVTEDDVVKFYRLEPLED